ncbi:glycosyltransferase family 2 protein [Anaerorhabdus sp.]|uniref:glycosyltransferase family 2 protein n=1 Tax=Anaerorhabdus sp. TaxID=1872524 RepID=UPI002FC8022B
MKLSIIIPCFNSEKYIGNLMKSIMKELNSDSEVIIIDDGSTDDTSRIIESYSCDKVIIMHIENLGVSNARNLGIEHARGDYVCFLDSDDFVEEKYIQRILSNIEQKPDIILFGCVSLYNENNLIYTLPNYNGKFEVIKNDAKFFNYNLLNSPCNKVYKRSILMENNIKFDVNLSISEDFRFNLIVFRFVENCLCIRDLHYQYNCMNENSLTKKSYNKLAIIEKENINLLRYLVDINNKETESYFFQYMINSIIYVLRRNIENNELSYYDRKEQFREFRNIFEFRNIKFDKNRRFIDKLFLYLIKLNQYLILEIIINRYEFFSKLYLKIKNRK